MRKVKVPQTRITRIKNLTRKFGWNWKEIGWKENVIMRFCGLFMGDTTLHSQIVYERLDMHETNGEEEEFVEQRSCECLWSESSD